MTARASRPQRWFAFIVAALVGAGSLALPPRHAAAEGSVVVYCSVIAQWCEVMRRDFERATGLQVAMTVKSAGETLAQIRAEKENPRADVWWGGGVEQYLQAGELGLLETYRSPSLGKLHPWARRIAEISKDQATGIYAGTLGIVWNTKELARRKLPEPRCWADLIKPEYKNEMQMANAASSGTSYAVIATLVQIMGEEPAFEFLKKLHLNMNQYPRSGAAPMRNVALGESTLAITWMFAAVSEAAAGFPVKTIAPCEGTGYEIGAVGLIKGGRNPEAARKWVEFVLSAPAQASGAKAKSYQIPSNVDAPLPPGTPKLNEVKLIDYDFAKYGQSALRNRLIKRWEQEVANRAK